VSTAVISQSRWPCWGATWMVLSGTRFAQTLPVSSTSGGVVAIAPELRSGAQP